MDVNDLDQDRRRKVGYRDRTPLQNVLDTRVYRIKCHPSMWGHLSRVSYVGQLIHAHFEGYVLDRVSMILRAMGLSRAMFDSNWSPPTESYRKLIEELRETNEKLQYLARKKQVLERLCKHWSVE